MRNLHAVFDVELGVGNDCPWGVVSMCTNL